MNITEFDAAIDTIEIDPRLRLKAIVKNLFDSELGRQGLSSDQISRFASSALRELAASAKACIESGDYTALDKHLSDFRMALRRVVGYEREHGSLKPITVASEIQRCSETLRRFLYLAHELTALEVKMKNGELIKSVTWGEIETSEQVIRRSEMPTITRPVTWRDGNTWRRQFVSDDRIAEAQAEEQRRQAPVANRFGQPSKWIE
jgi:hypothetical protein